MTKGSLGTRGRLANCSEFRSWVSWQVSVNIRAGGIDFIKVITMSDNFMLMLFDNLWGYEEDIDKDQKESEEE